MKRQEILEAVSFERNRQQKIWGIYQHHTPEEWLSILVEEVGEASEAINKKWYEDLKKELIQSAAVIVAWLEDIE